MDSKTKYFGLGILGGFAIVIIIFLLLFILPATGLLGTTTVAIIPVYGEIAYGSNDTSSVVTPDAFENALTQAENNPSVGAIVIDINSPGGSTVASDEMMKMVKNCSKPTVAWIGESGTSGAYLLASGADRIVASNSSLVGNIGTIITLTDMSNYNNKTGIKTYSIKSGEYKDIGANYKSINSNESKMLQTIVDNDADRFKSNVAANRNMSKSEVDKVADGSIYDGQQAKDNKLVDNVGSRKDAIELAVKLGGLPSTYDTETYSTDNTFYLGLTSQTNIINTLNRLIFK